MFLAIYRRTGVKNMKNTDRQYQWCAMYIYAKAREYPKGSSLNVVAPSELASERLVQEISKLADMTSFKTATCRIHGVVVRFVLQETGKLPGLVSNTLWIDEHNETIRD